uniref:Uncharacterized protein n=1 Tax=Carcinus maenas virus 1 TaxID=2704945 RepID=A0A6G9HDI2_9VIRU|nr:hypothetical protein [Carcinus maenas virus 1]
MAIVEGEIPKVVVVDYDEPFSSSLPVVEEEEEEEEEAAAPPPETDDDDDDEEQQQQQQQQQQRSLSETIKNAWASLKNIIQRLFENGSSG